MKRAPVYSSSPQASRRLPPEPASTGTPDPVVVPPAPPAPTPRHAPSVQRTLWLLAGGLIALVAVMLSGHFASSYKPLSQKDIDAAVLHALETQKLPSPAAKAYDVIRRSVVRVRGLAAEDKDGKGDERSTGTGVVIKENGTILTNLHVVAVAKKLKVVFDDGTESDATLVGTRPEHDLAVIRATTLPDDLLPATLRSTRDLREGDRIIAVGFPFGIGPSVSEGVVSGLRREYQSPEGERLLTNLIQFDAAANPGNSGGPLTTMEGEVVGIVTAILNPGEQPVFIGIGFAVPIENAAAAAGLSPF